MFKVYKDDRINKFIKKSFELAVKDEEWNIRYLQEWNILFEDIDKILEYVENDYRGELKVNDNMWWVLQVALVDILNLYDLELSHEDRVSEETLVIKKYNKNNILAKVFDIMEEYGWYFNDGNDEKRYRTFTDIYRNHYKFIESVYDYFADHDMNSPMNLNDISQQKLEDMVTFMSDFLRALNEIK